LKNLLLLLTTTLFALLCAEGILRLVEPQNEGKLTHFVETEDGGYRVPAPNATGLLYGRPVSINEFGYRGSSYPPERSEDTYRIQVFGDSHTFGSGAPDDQSYPAVMEKILNKQQERYEVLNFGVSSYDFGSIARYMSTKVPEYRPDLAIMTFHAGDIVRTDVIIDLRDTQNVPAHVRLRQKIEARSHLAKLIVVQGGGAVRSLFGAGLPGTAAGEIEEAKQNGPHWEHFKTGMLQLDADLQAQCTKLVVVLFPSMIDFETTPAIELHEIIASWLYENGIPALDLIPAYQASNREASDLWATLLDHHPNEEGYAIGGQAAANYINSLDKSGLLQSTDCSNRPSAL
jgi:lysophospholipase L1-like esterase